MLVRLQVLCRIVGEITSTMYRIVGEITSAV